MQWRDLLAGFPVLTALLIGWIALFLVKKWEDY